MNFLYSCRFLQYRFMSCYFINLLINSCFVCFCKKKVGLRKRQEKKEALLPLTVYMYNRVIGVICWKIIPAIVLYFETYFCNSNFSLKNIVVSIKLPNNTRRSRLLWTTSFWNGKYITRRALQCRAPAHTVWMFAPFWGNATFSWETFRLICLQKWLRCSSRLRCTKD